MKKPQKLVSLVIPVFNEAANLTWHHEVIHKHLSKLPYQFEIIYVNDGSSDDSQTILARLCEIDHQAHYISFSRNFGKEAATTAGLSRCTGDAAIMLDADGQHPITLIDTFINKWQHGAQVVVGVRTGNTGEGLIKRYGSKLFYAILDTLVGSESVAGATDFRLIDRKVIDAFNSLSERNRITRGLIDWLGFRRVYVPFVAPKRHAGKAGYDIKKLFGLALHGVVSRTTKPLQLTGILGGAVVVLSAITAVFLAIETYIFRDPLHLAVTGSAIVALFVSFLVGVVLVCQWLLALYVESIHSETQNRPLYIIDEEL